MITRPMTPDDQDAAERLWRSFTPSPCPDFFAGVIAPTLVEDNRVLVSLAFLVPRIEAVACTEPQSSILTRRDALRSLDAPLSSAARQMGYGAMLTWLQDSPWSRRLVREGFTAIPGVTGVGLKSLR